MYLPFYLGSGSYFRSCRSAVNINNSRLDVIFQTQGCNGRISFERLNPKPSYSRYQCQIIFTTLRYWCFGRTLFIVNLFHPLASHSV